MSNREPSKWWLVVALVAVLLAIVWQGSCQTPGGWRTDVYSALVAVDLECSFAEQWLIDRGWCQKRRERDVEAWRIRTSDWFWVNYLADEDRPEP